MTTNSMVGKSRREERGTVEFVQKTNWNELDLLNLNLYWREKVGVVAQDVNEVLRKTLRARTLAGHN